MQCIVSTEEAVRVGWSRVELRAQFINRRASEIQGTALGKCLQAWPVYIYRSRPAGVAQSSHAFVGVTVSTWAR